LGLKRQKLDQRAEKVLLNARIKSDIPGDRRLSFSLCERHLLKSTKIILSVLEQAIHQHREGNLKAAESLYKRALKHARTNDVYFNFGVLCMQINEPKRADQLLLTALEMRREPRVLSALALTKERLNALREAESLAREACTLAPTNAGYYNNLGKILCARGNFTESIKFLNESLSYADSPEARYNLANAYIGKGDHWGSITALQQLLERYPTFLEARTQLGAIHLKNSNFNEAIQEFQAVLRTKLDHGDFSQSAKELLLTWLTLLDVPSVYTSQNELETAINKVDSRLSKLESALNKISSHELIRLEPNILYVAFKISNFYWAYQGVCERDRTTRYCQILRDALPQFCLKEARKNPATSRGAKRVGVISQYFGLHATTWIGSILTETLAPEVEVIYYVVNDLQEESYIQKLPTHFKTKRIECTDLTFGGFFTNLLSDRLDLLIYPDIGMTPFSRIASSFRLASTQAVHWAHPVTTGSPVMDYFLTSDLMETPSSEKNYTEKIIRLPGIGLYLEPNVPEAKIKMISEETSHQCASIQSLFKYLPKYDYLYPELIKKIPSLKIYFIKSDVEADTIKFVNRLKAEFHRNGLVLERHVTLVDRMSKIELQHFLSSQTFCLDSVGWSGGNTTLDAIAACVPLITCRGNTLRANHSSAILEKIILPELICSSISELVARAERLVFDQDFNQLVREKIRNNRKNIFLDQEVLSNFRTWLESLAVNPL
jgi:predicted O-linked N-acetylglucosamine transferase (SPINDLY family)